MTRLFLVAVMSLISFPVIAQEEACLYGSKAYSLQFSGCFRKVILECEGFNDWREKGSCADSGVPDGNNAEGLPDSFEGPLCNAGSYYSPDAEGCIAGVYQRCDDDKTWDNNITPIDGAEC